VDVLTIIFKVMIGSLTILILVKMYMELANYIGEKLGMSETFIKFFKKFSRS